jgi:hypothetical protein
MANTYTTKLGLAKPANGDVDWHIPINQNWDDIDSKLGPLYEDITNDTTKLTVKKDIDMSSNDIDNVGVLTAEKIKTTSYLWTTDPGLTKPRYINNTYVSNYTTSWVTVKTTPAAKIGVLGTATIYYNISATGNNGGIRLLKNDVVVPKSEYTVTLGGGSLAIDVPITTGDVFKLQIQSHNSNYTCYNNVFGIYALMTPIIDETETWS